VTDRRRQLAFNARTKVKELLAKVGVDVRRVRSFAETGGVGDMVQTLVHLRRCGLQCHDVLDVGANRGEWAQRAIDAFPEAAITMIEPQEEMRVPLERFCRSHPGSRWVQAVAGPSSGTTTLTVFHDLVGSTVLPPPSEEQRSWGRQRDVRMVAIDDLYDGPLPGLVKLDVQGYELEALAGATKLFGTTEVFILEAALMEFMPGQPVLVDVIGFMADRGYSLYDLAGFARRPSDGALGQVDLCLARTDGFLRASNAW
jgi:FkbM family methyltransferase